MLPTKTLVAPIVCDLHRDLVRESLFRKLFYRTYAEGCADSSQFIGRALVALQICSNCVHREAIETLDNVLCLSLDIFQLSNRLRETGFIVSNQERARDSMLLEVSNR